MPVPRIDVITPEKPLRLLENNTLNRTPPIDIFIDLAKEAGVACTSPAEAMSRSEAPRRAYEYARDVINGSWPEAEAVIRQDAKWAYEYALYVMKDRWPEAEAVIRQDAKWAYWYARDVVKDRWPEAEEIIRQDAEWAYWYALLVIKGRWPEAEEIIRQNAVWVYRYARDVIKDRWPEAEDASSTALRTPTTRSVGGEE